MAKKVQLMTNAKEWQTVNGVEVLVDVPQEDIDPITDSNCIEIEGHRTLEETISQENMFTPEIVETKVHSKVGGVYHDNVVDGAYEEAILYGNTQVNLVESMTSDTKYIPHSFTSFQGNESKIGNYHSGRTNQVAPLVKGVTMVNLCQETSVTIVESESSAIENVKPNTEYTLVLDFTVQNTQKGFSIHSFKDNTYLETTTVRTGMGEKIKFTFTTHEEANTIYIVNNRGFGGEIQLDNIMVIEGDVTDLNLPFFKGMRSVELSRPLTNLFTDDLQIYKSNVTSTINNGNITVTSTGIATWAALNIYFKDILKPHTQYLVMWDSLSYNHTGSALATIAVYDDNGKGISEINKPSTQCPTLRSLVFDTKDYDVNYIKLRIHATTTNSETGTTTVTGLRVFEWDDSLRSVDLQYLGYFSGTKYVSARALETEGKNLYPYGDINFTSEFADSWCDAKGNAYMTSDIALKSQSRFLLKKGIYCLSHDGETNISALQIVDDKENLLYNPITLKQDTYCTVRVKTINANTLTTVTNIQIERGETATTYEAYQGRYYKPRETEEIILRSLPNGVCDTFNLQTGELVQNIGEVVFDGSEDEKWKIRNDNASGFMYFHSLNITGGVNLPCLCAELKTVKYRDFDDGVESVGINLSYEFRLNFSNCNANNGATVEDLIAYLQSNPLKVQYQLEEPIITKLQTYDRIYNGQRNILTSMGNNLSALTYRYSTDYLKVANLSPVPAILEPITTIPYDVRLKPSTLYTIKYNRGGASNSMKFDLGGSVVEKTNSITSTTGIAEELTVRTPAILSHEQLILSGTGFAHNFIVVEGDITGTELPYFEGMKDVKMPIVKNIGKNLFDIQSIYQGLKNIAPNNVLLLNDNTLQIKSTGKWHKEDLGKPIKFKKNTRYTLSFNAQDINNIGGLPDTIICFVYTDGTTSYSRTWGDNVCISTAGKTVDYIEFSYGFGDGRMVEFSNFMLVEGTEAQPYEPCKENSVYAVQGEYPITSEMFEQGGFNGTDKIGQPYDNCKVSENENIRIRTKELIPIKTNTQYIILNQTSPYLNHVFYYFDGNKKFLGQQAEVNTNKFTTPNDCCYVSLMFSKNNNANITTTDVKQEQFHMYELDSTINLRSLPNGVKDELNLLTGEYIQRVGEVVVDGSGHFTMKTNNNGQNYTVFYFEGLNKATEHGISNYLPAIQLYDATVLTTDGFCANISNLNEIRLFINGLTSVEDYIGYFSNKPLTIQYELAEPIISHVRLVSNNQEREVGVKLPNGVCNTYNPSTSITTVRVGKVVLDGSENWVLDTTKTNTQVFKLGIMDMKLGTNNNVVCDSLPLTDKSNSDTEKIASTQTYEVDGRVTWGIYIALLKTKASTVDELKTYLASNPMTVWYQLKYPQIQPDIVLPNGVHDEYNPETGVYTKKVGFAEFDGSEDEKLDTVIYNHNKENTIVFFAYQYTPLAKKYGDRGKGYPIYTNQFEYVDVDLGQSSGGGVSMDVEGAYMAFDGNVCFAISKEKLKPFGFTDDMNTKTQVVPIVSKYLSQNPLKVWYELETPITYQLTPYFALPQPYAYEDGYLVHESAYPETTLPPEFKYKLVANRTGQIVQNGRKLQEHTTRLSNLEALIIEATIESLFNRELQLFELELMDIQLIDLGE